MNAMQAAFARAALNSANIQTGTHILAAIRKAEIREEIARVWAQAHHENIDFDLIVSMADITDYEHGTLIMRGTYKQVCRAYDRLVRDCGGSAGFHRYDNETYEWERVGMYNIVLAKKEVK